MASPQRTDGTSPRTAPRDMHTQSVRPNAVHHRVAKETDASRREHRDRLVTAKRMRLQGDVNLSEADVEAIRTALQGTNVVAMAGALEKLHAALVEPSHAVRSYVLEGKAMDAIATCLRSANADLQMRALWCMSNLAAGASDVCQKSLAAAPLLIQLLSSGNPLFEEQAAFTLGNLAADGPLCRDTVVANGAILPLARLLETQASKPFEVTAASAFALANILHGGRQHIHTVWQTGVAPALVEHIRADVPALASEVAWVLAYLTAGDRQLAAQLLEMGLGPHLVAQLAKIRPATAVALPLMRTVGNLICASDVFAVALGRDAEFLPSVFHCLEADSRPLLKETLWTLSNFTVAPPEHVALVESTGLLRLVNAIFLSQTFDIRKEAMYTIINVGHHGPDHLAPLIDHGLAKGVVELLRSQDPEMVAGGLQLVEIILRTVPKGPQLLETADGMDALEMLAYRTEPFDFSQRAGQLVQTYYGADYEGAAAMEQAEADAAADGDNDNDGMDGAVEYPAWRQPPHAAS